MTLFSPQSHRSEFSCAHFMHSASASSPPAASARVSARSEDTANQQTIALGEEELGPYTLKSPLGTGGMGEVYLAEHRLLKRMCAIKLIDADRAGDSGMKNRFEREVNVTATLTHPNTVEVYDYGTTSTGRFFYAMEYLNGLNLQQFVNRFGPMSPGRTVFILKQICGALHEAHTAELVHRDIKPSNIFLSERGQMYDVAKLLDFGLVQSSIEVGMKHESTQIQGSPQFMCPEQARGLEPDCRGDLYSLGAVAYYLLTGNPPFQDENPLMLIVAHATTDVPDFADVGVSVPDDLTSVIMKCLAKRQEDRFNCPRNLLLALEDCSANGEWNWRDAEDWWLDLGADVIASSRERYDVPTDHAAGGADTIGNPDCDKTLIFDDGV